MDCRDRLEATKSTLDVALASINFLCSLRSAGRDVVPLPGLEASLQDRDLDAGSVLQEYAESIASRSPSVHAASELATTLDDWRVSDPTSLTSELSMATAAAKAVPKSEDVRLEEEENKLKFRAFHRGLKRGDLKLVELMLNNGFDANIRRTVRHPTALHIAVFLGRADIVKVLLDHGADISAVEHNGYNALQRAVHKNHVEIALLLIERGSPLLHKQKCSSTTVLHMATSKGNLKIVKALIRKGKDVGQLLPMLQATNQWGLTALHHAARGGSLEIVQILVESGADIDARNFDQETPLIFAALFSSLDVMRYLVAQGSDVHAKDRHCNYALAMMKQRYPENWEEHLRFVNGNQGNPDTVNHSEEKQALATQ